MSNSRFGLIICLAVFLATPAMAQIKDTRWWVVNFGAIKEGLPPSFMCHAVYSPEEFAQEIYAATEYHYELVKTQIGYLHLVGSDLGSYVLSPTVGRCLDIARRLMLKQITEEEVFDIYLQPKEVEPTTAEE